MTWHTENKQYPFNGMYHSTCLTVFISQRVWGGDRSLIYFYRRNPFWMSSPQPPLTTNRSCDLYTVAVHSHLYWCCAFTCNTQVYHWWRSNTWSVLTNQTPKHRDKYTVTETSLSTRYNHRNHIHLQGEKCFSSDKVKSNFSFTWMTVIQSTCLYATTTIVYYVWI